MAMRASHILKFLSQNGLRQEIKNMTSADNMPHAIQFLLNALNLDSPCKMTTDDSLDARIPNRITQRGKTTSTSKSFQSEEKRYVKTDLFMTVFD